MLYDRYFMDAQSLYAAEASSSSNIYSVDFSLLYHFQRIIGAVISFALRIEWLRHTYDASSLKEK